MLDGAVSALEKLAVLVACGEELRVEARTWFRIPSQPHRTQAWLEDRAQLFRKLERDVAGVGNGVRPLDSEVPATAMPGETPL